MPISDEAKIKLVEKYLENKEIIDLNHERLQKNAFMLMQAGLLTELNWETLLDLDIIEDQETFTQDFSVLREIIKALISRQVGLQHPLIHVLDVVSQTLSEKV